MMRGGERKGDIEFGRFTRFHSKLKSFINRMVMERNIQDDMKGNTGAPREFLLKHTLAPMWRRP